MRNLIYSEQLFGIHLEVKVIRNWAINCILYLMNALLFVLSELVRAIKVKSQVWECSKYFCDSWFLYVYCCFKLHCYLSYFRWILEAMHKKTNTIDCEPSRTHISLCIYSVWLVSLPLWRMWVCYFLIDILGQVWYLIVSIPDLCTLTYFHELLDTQWVHRKDSDRTVLIVRLVSLCWTHMLFCWFGASSML